jgi:Icc-related predicted phosphoesterase
MPRKKKKKKSLKLVCISDTHCAHEVLTDEMPDGDILICAGDITGRGEVNEILRFNEWVGRLKKYEHTILIAGNHDSCFESKFLRELMNNCLFLHDSSTTIRGVKFTGSPWTPRFGNWSFMRPRGGEIARIWNNIPEDTEVLITHGPPHGILDKIPGRKIAPGEKMEKDFTIKVGCKDLRKAIKNRIKPKVNCFGHIHEGYGVLEEDGITYVNASIMNKTYDPVNKPIVVEVECSS